MLIGCSAVRIGRGVKSSLSERGRYNGTVCSTSLQSVGVPKCPKWFCCSAVRTGRGVKSSISEKGRYNGTVRSRTVQNVRDGCPKWFIVVSDIGRNIPQREGATTERYVQRVSKVSECPSVQNAGKANGNKGNNESNENAFQNFRTLEL